MVYTGFKISLLASGAVVGGGILYKSMFTPPKDIADKLIKQGYELPTKDSEWKIILDENIEELKRDLNIETTVEISNLKQYCKGLYEKSPEEENAEQKAIRYCTYSPRTIKGLILKGKFNKLLDENSDEKKWKTIYNIQRYSREFNNLLKDIATESLSWMTDTDTGTPLLKTWCKETLKKEWRKNKEDVHNVQKYCSDPGISTVEELIKLENPRWEMATNWAENAKIWEKNISVQMKVGNSNIQVENIKEWCEKHKSDALDLNESYSGIYQVVRDACRKL